MRKVYPRYLKRPTDIIISVVALPFAVGPMLLLAILIKASSPGPVIFKQKRLGKNGKVFTLYQFRTMKLGAHELDKSLSPEQLEEFAKDFKLENDPRITKIGNILRKTSLDELPQILNILVGHMSIVGPRPLVPQEIKKFGKHGDKMLSAAPGLTGYWACSGRSDIPYKERVKMELYYIDNISAKLDAKIFAKTALGVIKREGAK
jgi:lipopolysaccharide/colanic/teichoic acid biosynthesis glycosyltransferase